MARRRPTNRRFNISVVNLKLRSNNRQGDEAYKDIINQIHRNKISIPVLGTTNIILRTCFSDIADINGSEIEYIYGKMSKYTVIDGNDWLNMNNMEVEDVELPLNYFPNLKETDYVFIPSAHRFVIINNGTVKIKQAGKFLYEAMQQVIARDEQHEAIIEQSEDVFERITNAESVRKLLINISYSNADTGDEAYEFMDAQIRESEMQRLKLEATPNQNGNINTDSVLLKGSLGVAQSNGFVQATIIEGGHKVRIDTNEHPLLISLQCEDSQRNYNVVAKIMSIFRRHNNGN